MWKYIALVIVALLILPQILQVVVLIFYSVIALIENVLDERKESKNEKRQKLQKSTPESKHEKMPISGWALIIYYVSFHILAYFSYIADGDMVEATLDAFAATVFMFVVSASPFLAFRYCIYKRKINVVLSHVISFAYVLVASLAISTLLDTDYSIGWINAFINASILYCGKDTRKANAAPKEPERLEIVPDEQVVIQNEPSEYELQMRRDYNRYTYLRNELKKIPMEDVNQWHDNGKITDVQYNEICSAYNAMKEEMEEIRKRVRVLNQVKGHRSENK